MTFLIGTLTFYFFPNKKEVSGTVSLGHTSPSFPFQKNFILVFAYSIFITKQKWKFGCRHPKSQTHEANDGAKGKRFYLGALHPVRMANSRLKDHLIFLPWKKSTWVLGNIKTKASVLSSCSILKDSPLEPTGSC